MAILDTLDLAPEDLLALPPALTGNNNRPNSNTLAMEAAMAINSNPRRSLSNKIPDTLEDFPKEPKEWTVGLPRTRTTNLPTSSPEQT